MEQFLSIDSDGMFCVEKKAAVFLRAVPAPCTIVSVVGRYRTGKSSLLNGLANQKIFSTSPTVQAHTKGLSLFSPEEGLILVDSEGLGSTLVSKHHDAALFAITMVISSGCFFNNQGAITSQDLEDLRLAAKVAGLLVTHGKLGIAMPPLVWVLRDFSLTLKDVHGIEMDATAYLEECMTNATESAADLVSLFPVREAMTLCRPSDRELDIQTLTNLRPEFRVGLEQLRRRMHYFPSKSRAGHQMSGADVCDLAEALCAALNGSGTVPSVESVWGCMVEKMRASAKRTATATFQLPGVSWSSRIRETMSVYVHCLRGEHVSLEEGVALLEELSIADTSYATLAERWEVQHRKVQIAVETQATEILGLTEQLAEATNIHGFSQERVMALTTTTLTLGTQLQETEHRLLEERERCANLETTLKNGVEQLKTRYKSLVLESEHHKSYREELAAKLARVMEDLKDARYQTTTLQQQCTQHKRRGEDSASKLSELQDVSGQLRTDVEVWRSRYEDGQTRHAKRLKTVDATQLELITAQAELQYLRRSKVDYDTQLLQLHTENAALQRQLQTLSVYTSFDQPM
jgi:hypothetical protein